MTGLKERLRDRRITGMHGNYDPNDWGIHLAEGVDPLCVEAADEIKRLENLHKFAQEVIEIAVEMSSEWEQGVEPSVEMFRKLCQAVRRMKR